MGKMIDIPPVWLAGFACVAYVQGQVIPTDLLPATDFLGGILVTLGLALMGAAFFEFWRHKTTVIPHQHASALIQTGIFGVTRNPIYLADALILAGLCLRWEATISLVLVPVFVWIITKRFILDEEQRLQDAFGAAFVAYKSSTKRWVL